MDERDVTRDNLRVKTNLVYRITQHRYYIYLGENQMIFCYFTVQIRNYESKFTIPSCDCVLERLKSHLDFGSFSFDMAMTSFGVGHKHHKSYDQKYAALDVRFWVFISLIFPKLFYGISDGVNCLFYPLGFSKLLALIIIIIIIVPQAYLLPIQGSIRVVGRLVRGRKNIGMLFFSLEITKSRYQLKAESNTTKLPPPISISKVLISLAQKIIVFQRRKCKNRFYRTSK